MAAAHPVQDRRIVAGLVLRPGRRRGGGQRPAGAQRAAPQNADPHGDPVEKVPAVDGPVHPQRLVGGGKAFAHLQDPRMISKAIAQGVP